MEITSINNIDTDVEFSLVCSICKQEVESSDKFCRNCGKRLYKIPLRVSMDTICRILTKAMRNTSDERASGFPKKDSKEDESYQPTEERNDNKQDASDIQELFGFRVSCPRCRQDKKGCPYIGLDGLCHGIVYPTCPPQYDKCVFDR